jgi:hypothetical protein
MYLYICVRSFIYSNQIATFFYICSAVTCDSEIISDPANTCVVVSGALTLHTDSGNADSEAVIVRGLLQEKIENGEFDGSQTAIVRVSYVELLPSSNANQNNEKNVNSGGGGGNDNLPIGVISAAAAGSFFFIIGAVVYGRRKKSNSAADASTVATPALLPDDSSKV